MKNALFFLLPVLLILNGCSKNDQTENDPVENNPPANDGLFIRVKNTSAFDYENVQLNASGGENQYGSLQSGQHTAYKEFAASYNYIGLRLEIGGEPIVFAPRDYHGAQLLENGLYTLEISANVDGNSSMHLNAD